MELNNTDNTDHKDSPRIWVLADDRAGNVNQALGVAEALGLPFETKNIQYTSWARLPNIIRGATLLGLTRESKEQLTAPWPDLVISAGRKLVPIARHIKKKSGGKTVLAHMMNPGFPSHDLDLIAVPEHDKALLSKNMIETLGAPNRISDTRLSTEANAWYSAFGSYTKPRIAVLVGGDNKYGPFTLDHTNNLLQSIKSLVDSCKGSVLISNSRRTRQEITEHLKQNLPKPHYFYDVNAAENPQANPYFGFLAVADALVVSGDSVSMCSEACTTGKPVYIFAPEGMLSPKHQRFVSQLVEKGYARLLDNTSTLANTPPPRLQETQKIASAIRTILLSSESTA